MEPALSKPFNTEAVNDRGPRLRVSRDPGDVDVPGVEVELDPDAADRAGAFEEAALDVEDAAASTLDGPDRDDTGEPA